ncbi:MAG: YciI family protein [bacterium]
MHYMLMMYETPDAFAQRQGQNAGEYWGAWSAYSAAIVEAGIFVSGNGLPSAESSTSLRFTESGKSVQDGPFADSREQLGGYFIIDVPDLDTALEWAGRSPSLPGGGVEVRPVLSMS